MSERSNELVCSFFIDKKMEYTTYDVFSLFLILFLVDSWHGMKAWFKVAVSAADLVDTETDWSRIGLGRYSQNTT